jgi:RecJ-like exonuclease
MVCVYAATSPLLAHHAFGVEFDAKQRVTLKGQVTKIEWTNPHTYFYVDVKEETGRVVNWAFEAAGPNTLAHLGWDRKSMKIGDQVTVTGYRARDASNIASAREVVLADGRKVFAGSAVDGGPQR